MAQSNQPKNPVPEARIRKVAKEKLGYESLRPGQREAVSAVLEGHDTRGATHWLRQIGNLPDRGASCSKAPP